MKRKAELRPSWKVAGSDAEVKVGGRQQSRGTVPCCSSTEEEEEAVLAQWGKVRSPSERMRTEI